MYLGTFGHVPTCVYMSPRSNESFVPKQQRKECVSIVYCWRKNEWQESRAADKHQGLCIHDRKTVAAQLNRQNYTERTHSKSTGHCSIQEYIHRSNDSIQQQPGGIIHNYCDGFAQGIAGRQPGGHVLAHEPRNNTVEVFSLCPRMDRCYTAHARWRNTTVAVTWRVSRDACLCHGYITRLPV
jgi:hypothetical protein